MKKIYFLLLSVILGLSALAQTPSTQASNVQITYKTTSGATISWTRGNGDRCVVLVRKSSSSNATPPSSTTLNFTASATYGNGYSFGSGDNFLVYDGTGTSVFISGLTANQTYYAYVYEYDIPWFGSTDYYNTTTSSANSEFFNTLDTSPTAYSNVTSVTPSYTSASIFVSSGTGGDGRMIYLRPSTGSNVYPTDGYTYAANVNYGSGSALGGGYVVYMGTGTSVNVLSGLQPATLYYAYSHVYSDGNYPTQTLYNYNSRNYYNNSASYGFYTLNNPPTIASVSSLTVCQNASQQTVNLSGIGDGSSAESQTMSISATSNNTGLIPNPTITYTSPSSTGSLKFTPVSGQSGTAIITVTANDGWHTSNTTSVTFTVTVRPIPATAGVISGSSPICAGSSASYTVPAIANATGYTWAAPPGYSITSGQGTTVVTISTTTATPTGSISVYGTNSFGCGNGTASTKSIQIDAQPSTPDAGPDQPLICSGTAFLNATATSGSNIGSWSWYTGTPTPSLGNASSNSTSISGLTSPQTYQYIWTVTRSGSVCPAKKDTVTITTNFADISCTPSANFSYSPVSDVSATTVCRNSSLNFTDLSVGQPDTWEWDFNYNGSIPNYTSVLQNPSYSYTAVGTYTVYMRIHSTTTGLYYNTQKTINVVDAPAAPSTIFGTTSSICAGSSNQYNYSIAAVTNATNYNWSTMSGGNIIATPSSTSIVIEYDNTAAPGNITVSASNSCGTSSNASLMVNLTPLPSAPGSISGSGSVCQGEQNVTYTVPSIANATTYIWTALDGSTSITALANETFDIGLNDQTGRIYVKGQNSCGTGDSSNIGVAVNPLPDNAGAISGQQLLQLCPTATNVSYEISPVGNATSYSWSISNGNITFGAGTDSITIDFTGVNSLTTIQVTPNNACGSRDASPVHNIVFNPLPLVDVCVASVDTASLHNEIFWMRPASTEIDSFRVYRRLGAMTDTLVGTVAYEDPSYLLDTLNDYDPNTNFEEYAIAAVDSCGNEGQRSLYHRTMFLATSNGTGTVNLGWNLYVGQIANFYRIYRDTTIAGGQWELLDGSVNPSVTLWVDNAPFPNARYRVEIDWLTTCDPTRGAINTSRSNIKSPSSLIGVKEINLTKDLNVYPNPAKSNVTVAFNKESKFETIEMYDALGRKVLSSKIDKAATEYTFTVEGLATGMYNIILNGSLGKATKKLIVD